MLRTNLIIALGRTGYLPLLTSHVVWSASTSSIRWTTIPVELHAAVYATAIAFGENATLEQFLEVGKYGEEFEKILFLCTSMWDCLIYYEAFVIFQVYNLAPSRGEKLTILKCIGNAPSAELIDRVLDFTMFSVFACIINDFSKLDYAIATMYE